MNKLVVIVSFLTIGSALNAQSAQIKIGGSGSAPVKHTSGVTTSAPVGFDLSKSEADNAQSLLNLTPEQYAKVLKIYEDKNMKLDVAKVKYSNDVKTYSSEATIIENSADQLIYQQLTTAQQPKWMDVIRAKQTIQK